MALGVELRRTHGRARCLPPADPRHPLRDRGLGVTYCAGRAALRGDRELHVWEQHAGRAARAAHGQRVCCAQWSGVRVITAALRAQALLAEAQVEGARDN